MCCRTFTGSCLWKNQLSDAHAFLYEAFFFFLMCVCVVVSFVPGGVFQDRSERGEGKIRTSLDLIGWFHAVEFEPKNQVNKKQIIHGKLFIIDEHVLKDETEQN